MILVFGQLICIPTRMDSSCDIVVFRVSHASNNVGSTVAKSTSCPMLRVVSRYEKHVQLMCVTAY